MMMNNNQAAFKAFNEIRREINGIVTGNQRYDFNLEFDSSLAKFKDNFSKLDVTHQATHDLLKDHWIKAVSWIDIGKSDKQSVSVLMSIMSELGNVCHTDTNKNSVSALDSVLSSMSFEDKTLDDTVQVMTMLGSHNKRHNRAGAPTPDSKFLNLSSSNDYASKLNEMMIVFNEINGDPSRTLNREKLDEIFTQLETDDDIISGSIENFAVVASSRINYTSENASDLLYFFKKMNEKSNFFDGVYEKAGSFRHHFPQYNITDKKVQKFKSDLSSALNKKPNLMARVKNKLSGSKKEQEAISEKRKDEIMGYSGLPGKRF